MLRSFSSLWIAVAVVVGAMAVLNLPSCEGGGGQLVDGDWMTFAELSEMSRDWPRTRATVITSHVEVTSSSLRNKRDRMKKAVIEYEYEVDGRRHIGKRVQFKAPTEEEAENWVSFYPVGVEITVSYMPENPRTSVIVPGP